MENVKLSQYYMMINKYFAKKLKQLRTENEPPISQEKLANEIGVTRTTLAGYEDATTSPPWWFVCVISKYFGKKLSEFSYLDHREEDKIEDFS